MRLSVANIKRLTSLAGKLQMESGKQKTLDDAINYLFDFLEAKNESQTSETSSSQAKRKEVLQTRYNNPR